MLRVVVSAPFRPFLVAGGCQSDVMAPPAAWFDRLSAVVGPLGRVRPLGGASLVESGVGALVVKTGPGCADEADGLRRLGAVVGAPPVPHIVLAEADLLVTTAVDRAERSGAHDETLGRALAMLHRAPFPRWGGGSSWIGRCPVDPAPARDAAGFYGARLAALAARSGLHRAVDPVLARLADLVPPGPPALVHGDLWWGNVLPGVDGRSWLIDPSVHGGHPEEDLAMLALFGAVPTRLRAAYAEVLPPCEGWEQREALFQLYPLLVHAVLFGGSYRERVEEYAGRFG
jgi:fructosamine-3-kinase